MSAGALAGRIINSRSDGAAESTRSSPTEH